MAHRRPLLLPSLLLISAGMAMLGPGDAGIGAKTVMAQAQSLPPQIANSQQDLTKDQISQIETYVKASLAQVFSGTPTELAKGRRSLQVQFGGGSSPFFIVAYSRVIIDEMQKARVLDQSKPRGIRLNAMIIMADCIDSRMATVVEEALKDTDPAVRYWAAIGADRFLSNALTNPDYSKFTSLVSKDQQESLLKALRSPTVEAGSAQIADQVLMAMSKLTIIPAREALLQRLNERVTAHARVPLPDVSADLKALSALVVRLLNTTSGQQVTQPELKELARLTYREMALCLEILQKRQLSQQDDKQYRDLLQLSEKWLKWSVDNLTKSTGTTPVANFDSLVALREWPRIRLALIEFRDQKLLKDPIGLKAEEVESELIK